MNRSLKVYLRLSINSKTEAVNKRLSAEKKDYEFAKSISRGLGPIKAGKATGDISASADQEKRMERSGFTPPLVFELQDSERELKVWLG